MQTTFVSQNCNYNNKNYIREIVDKGTIDAKLTSKG